MVRLLEPPLACVDTKPGEVSLGDAILVAAPEARRPLVEAAIDYWRACPNYGVSFPAFVVSGNADRSASAQHVDASVANEPQKPWTQRTFGGIVRSRASED
ncbi:MAG: hypothetical protein R3190_13665, partial [Thermoanaerobaculia bacterium]|nr:hypothetical protein [Thermoanaerobaculia bacterium]